MKESKSELLGKTAGDKADVYQWIEYADVYLQQRSVSQVISDLLPVKIKQTLSILLFFIYWLQGLNGVLSSKTYLASNKLTIADVILYYMLLSVMVIISAYF